MNTVGFLISHKNMERRRALLPEDAAKVCHRDHIYVESGYCAHMGYTDDDYRAAGVRVVTREEALRCRVLVDVKLGDTDFMPEIAPGKILIGWAHIAQKTAFCDAAVQGGHTVLAWEDMTECGRYIFYRNRELAGEMAIMQAFTCYGKMPYDCSVAVIGNGMTARGACRVLTGLGARVDVYPRKLETLFRRKMTQYDVLVNCVMWDTNRKDRLIYREELKKLKRGAMIVDVSCDPNLEIETTRATTIEDPVYTVDGVLHYAVDNTPAMAYRAVTRVLSAKFAPFLDDIILGLGNDILANAIVVRKGVLTDENAIAFRKRLAECAI